MEGSSFEILRLRFLARAKQWFTISTAEFENPSRVLVELKTRLCRPAVWVPYYERLRRGNGKERSKWPVSHLKNKKNDLKCSKTKKRCSNFETWETFETLQSNVGLQRRTHGADYQENRDFEDALGESLLEDWSVRKSPGESLPKTL